MGLYFAMCLFLVNLLISYWFMRYMIYDGEIKITQHGTPKYLFTIFRNSIDSFNFNSCLYNST